MNNDIVTRLRAVLHNDRSVELMNREAADEIEQLRKENRDMRELVSHQGEIVLMAQKRHEERDEARREIERLKKGGCARDQRTTQYCAEAVRLEQERDELFGTAERLRKERDEARRRLCLEWMEHGPVRLSKEQIAMRYGWDCFKENTNG